MTSQDDGNEDNEAIPIHSNYKFDLIGKMSQMENKNLIKGEKYIFYDSENEYDRSMTHAQDMRY